MSLAQIRKSTPGRNSGRTPATPVRRSLGQNASIAPVIQARLRVGAPGDAYEQEANRVDRTVVSAPRPGGIDRASPTFRGRYRVRRLEFQSERGRTSRTSAVMASRWRSLCADSLSRGSVTTSAVSASTRTHKRPGWPSQCKRERLRLGGMLSLARESSRLTRVAGGN
jgi:hypothetical protein